jgi:RNA polymerase subunit RPABC4/transcription elongation factor Spt4
MKCSVCSTLNRSDARFCSQCGSSLGLNECPGCKTKVEPGARFCSTCGTALLCPAEEAGRTCQSCGFVNPKETVYCKRCNQKIL